MPGRLPLMRVAVPSFSCASRACRAAAVLIPACPAITATAAPAGSADSAARTAAAGLSPAAGVTGAGTGSVAVSAALRAASGAGVLVRAMVVTPFPIPRRNSRFHLPAPVFSGRQLLWSGREVKRLRDNSRCRFPPGPAGTEICRHSLSSPGTTTRDRDLAGGFPGGSHDRILTFGIGCRDFSAPAAFSFPAAFIPVLRSGARIAFPRRGSGGAGAGGDRAGDRLAGGGGVGEDDHPRAGHRLGGCRSGRSLATVIRSGKAASTRLVLPVPGGPESKGGDTFRAQRAQRLDVGHAGEHARPVDLPARAGDRARRGLRGGSLRRRPAALAGRPASARAGGAAGAALGGEGALG